MIFQPNVAGLSDVDRDNRFYGYFSAVSDVAHFPPIRSFARIFVRRRNLQVFTSNAGAAKNNVLLIDPKLTARARRARFLLGRPVTGSPAANDEASDVRWVAAADLDSLDIHPTQWRQLRDWIDDSSPHVD